jgi:Ca-activated chloride channel family protein
MHFANPAAFFLVIFGLAIGWLREASRFRPGARLPFPELKAVRALPQTWRVRFRWLPSALLYLGLFLGIVALARPQTLLKGEAARAKGIDIMVVLDTSGSMRAIDFKPLDRMGAAKRAVKNFISKRQYDRIGLVVFAGVSLLQCPLTLDYAALLDFLDQVDVGMTTTENTAIGTAIATACNHLKRSTAKSRILVLVTDGRSNAGEIDPLTAAKAAQSLGIKIYTIGVAIRGQSFIPVDTVFGKQLAPIAEDLDEPTLQEIAQTTEGRYFRATSPRELEQIYGEIDRLEKSEVKGPAPVEYKDRYFPWLMAAMILLTIGFALELVAMRTVP